MTSPFKFRTFLSILFIKVNIYAWLYINILMVLRYVLLYLLTMSFKLLMYTFYDTEVMYL